MIMLVVVAHLWLCLSRRCDDLAKAVVAKGRGSSAEKEVRQAAKGRV